MQEVQKNFAELVDSRFPGKSQQLVLPNDTYKAKLLGGLVDWKLEELESWLFHGTECLDDILREGVSSGHVHLMSKKYSAGTYFASDPRLAHYFARSLRSAADAHVEFKILLCLVAVGWCCKASCDRET